MPQGFELVDHTADLALRCWGDRPHDVFAQAALGMVAQIYDVEAVAPLETRRLELPGLDLELALAAWLNELLYLIEAEAFLGREFDVVEVPDEHGGGALVAYVSGEPDTRGRHPKRPAVKAATLHDLLVRRFDGGWEGYILLDV